MLVNYFTCSLGLNDFSRELLWRTCTRKIAGLNLSCAAYTGMFRASRVGTQNFSGDAGDPFCPCLFHRCQRKMIRILQYQVQRLVRIERECRAKKGVTPGCLEWKDPASLEEASFAHLPPGKTFVVLDRSQTPVLVILIGSWGDELRSRHRLSFPRWLPRLHATLGVPVYSSAFSRGRFACSKSRPCLKGAPRQADMLIEAKTYAYFRLCEVDHGVRCDFDQPLLPAGQDPAEKLQGLPCIVPYLLVLFCTLRCCMGKT